MKNKENKVIEAYYGYIGEIYVDAIAEEFEDKKEEIKNITFPKKLDTWVQDYIKKEEKSFTITGNIKKEEIIKIAESIEKIKR